MSVCPEWHGGAADRDTVWPEPLSIFGSTDFDGACGSSRSLDLPPSLASEPPDAGSPDANLTAAGRTLAGQSTLSRQLQTQPLPAAPVPIGYCARKRRFAYGASFRIEQSSKRLHVARAHNHPSGDPAPSIEDRELTKRLREVGELLGIRLLDHVILGDARCYSFADQDWPC